MRTNMIKDLLNNEAEELMKLAEVLHEGGGLDLSTKDKARIRTTLAGSWLSDMMTDIKFAFIDGNDSHIAQSIEEVIQTLKGIK